MRRCLLLLAVCVTAGCRSSGSRQENALDNILMSGISSSYARSEPEGTPEASDLDAPLEEVGPEHCLDPFADAGQLELDHLVCEVLRVNPSLEAAQASWAAAAELYTQATSFDDPQFRFLQGPTIFGPSNGAHLWRLQLQQRVPWFGKRSLRGEMALSAADVAGHEVTAARLELIEAAKSAFFDYSMLDRLQELLEAERRILHDRLRVAQMGDGDEQTAEYQLRQAQLDLFEIERRQEELGRAQRVAQGGINLLLHRPPDFPLPRPRRGHFIRELPDVHFLQHQALEQRPDLARAQSRIRSEEAALVLAYKDFYPDLDLMWRFDSTWDAFWLPSDANIRPQLGVNLYVPIQLGRRRAAVREAHAKVRRSRAELEQVAAKVQYEVQKAYEGVEESKRVLAMFPGIFAAVHGKVAALEAMARDKPQYRKELAAARRQLINYRVKECEALRNYEHRLAELEQAVGGPF